jgi:hypothetical protein
MTASRPFSYCWSRLQTGDEFDAEPCFATVWEAIGYAEPATPEQQPASKKQPAKPEPQKPTPDEQHRYRTRRLKADDD